MLQDVGFGHLELPSDIGCDVRRNERRWAARAVVTEGAVRVCRRVAWLLVNFLLLFLFLFVPVFPLLLGGRGWLRDAGRVWSRNGREHGARLDRIGYLVAPLLLNGILHFLRQSLDCVLVGGIGRVVVQLAIFLHVDRTASLNRESALGVPNALPLRPEHRLTPVLTRVLSRLSRQSGEVVNGRHRLGTDARLLLLPIVVNGRCLLRNAVSQRWISESGGLALLIEAIRTERWFYRLARGFGGRGSAAARLWAVGIASSLGRCRGSRPILAASGLRVFLVFESDFTSADSRRRRLDAGLHGGLPGGLRKDRPRNVVAHVAEGSPFGGSMERTRGVHGLEIARRFVALMNGLLRGKNILVPDDGWERAQRALGLWRGVLVSLLSPARE